MTSELREKAIQEVAEYCGGAGEQAMHHTAVHFAAEMLREREDKEKAIAALKSFMLDPAATAERELPLELPSDPQRMMDLIRYMRHELSREGLISEQEYALLVSDSDNGKRVARLESYDEFRLSLARAQEQIAQMTEFWDCAMSQSVGLRYNYETKVVTNERAESAEQQIAALQGRIEEADGLLRDQLAWCPCDEIHSDPPCDRCKRVAKWLTAPIAPEKGQD